MLQKRGWFNNGNDIMMKVNGSILYNLGADLQPLETLRPGRLIYNLVRLQNARARLDHFLHSHVLKPTTSLEKGENLLADIEALVAKGTKGKGRRSCQQHL